MLGLHAPQLQMVRALRTKRGRREHACFAVEGTTMLAEALAAARRPLAVYATERAAAALGELRSAVDERLFVVPERALVRLSDLESPPGLLAVYPVVLEAPGDLLVGGAPIALLAGISDPGNAGTLLRTADAFGIARAIFIPGGVEPHNPKLVRATMGAIFRLRLALGGPEEVLAKARAAGYTVVAATRAGVPLPAFRFPPRALIALGNERHGLSQALPSWDAAVAVPQSGDAESLNAAVAGGIIFYAFSQQFLATIRGA